VLTLCSRWPVWKASSVAGVAWLVFGGVEAVLILTLKVTALLEMLQEITDKKACL
jgi:hypothetical protein